MTSEDGAMGVDPHRREMTRLIREQEARQERMRHVQEFLSAPVFLDLSEMEVRVSDDADALAARGRDLDYRISVLSSVIGLLKDERAFLDRILSGEETTAPDADAEEAAPDTPAKTVPPAS